MNSDAKNKNLDELIARAIGRDKPKFDFDTWKRNHAKQIDIFRTPQKAEKATPAVFEPNMWRTTLWRRVGYIAAALLIVASWAACFVLSQRVNQLKDELDQATRDISFVPTDDSATINFYLEEHRDLVARHASFSSTTPQPRKMRVNQHDVLYYEVFEDGPEYMQPGIIVRGPSSQRETGSMEAPVISNGHTLTLSAARRIAGFDLVAPSWLRPAYALDEIRRIEGRDALQLLYTDGIDSVSLFEQPLDGHRGLSAKDFREYAVYRNTEQTGGTILAWRDDKLSYVLIGNAELSELMDMAQSISVGK